MARLPGICQGEQRVVSVARLSTDQGSSGRTALASGKSLWLLSGPRLYSSGRGGRLRHAIWAQND